MLYYSDYKNSRYYLIGYSNAHQYLTSIQHFVMYTSTHFVSHYNLPHFLKI